MLCSSLFMACKLNMCFILSWKDRFLYTLWYLPHNRKSPAVIAKHDLIAWRLMGTPVSPCHAAGMVKPTTNTLIWDSVFITYNCKLLLFPWPLKHKDRINYCHFISFTFYFQNFFFHVETGAGHCLNIYVSTETWLLGVTKNCACIQVLEDSLCICFPLLEYSLSL